MKSNTKNCILNLSSNRSSLLLSNLDSSRQRRRKLNSKRKIESPRENRHWSICAAPGKNSALLSINKNSRTRSLWRAISLRRVLTPTTLTLRLTLRKFIQSSSSSLMSPSTITVSNRWMHSRLPRRIWTTILTMRICWAPSSTPLSWLPKIFKQSTVNSGHHHTWHRPAQTRTFNWLDQWSSRIWYVDWQKGRELSEICQNFRAQYPNWTVTCLQIT